MRDANDIWRIPHVLGAFAEESMDDFSETPVLSAADIWSLALPAR